MDKDYADVIDADDYTQGLAEHPDIPQSDAGILRIISAKFENSNSETFQVLDLGCGPGRITEDLADSLRSLDKETPFLVTGLDISEGFISFAKQQPKKEEVSYILADFLTFESTEKFDVIFMQGLFHHVSLENREDWLKKCFASLKDDGIVVIGDEFIPDYNSAEQRILNVAGLYAYVVAYALQNGHSSLAKIESMNMVDDVCSGRQGAGHSNQELILFIQEQSILAYEKAYQYGVLSEKYISVLERIVEKVTRDADEIAKNNPSNNHDRGDYKVSIRHQANELELIGFKLKSSQVYGPVAWIGGMGVLVFEKQ